MLGETDNPYEIGISDTRIGQHCEAYNVCSWWRGKTRSAVRLFVFLTLCGVTGLAVDSLGVVRCPV